MSGTTGRGSLPRPRRGDLAAKMPGRCVGPSRLGLEVRRPWGRRWGAGPSRGYGARRRARSSVWERRCMSAERRQRPLGRIPTAEVVAGVSEALGTPGTAGFIETARDHRAVWVNGALGEPEVVGPAGSVWVTGSGEEADDRSPRGCERKGRPGSLGHGSILELWLKVQAMRAASGCGDGSRVELCPVPAGEGPVERGVPGRASWVETSRRGVTGPWVKGQVRAVPQAELPTVMKLRAGCEGVPTFCGHGQTGRVLPPVSLSETVDTIGSAHASGPWQRGQTRGVPGTIRLPETVGVPRTLEIEVGCGDAPGLWGRGPLVQVPGALAQDAVCENTRGLSGRQHSGGIPNVMMVPRAVEEETTPMYASGLWQRRQEADDIGSEGIPALWGTGQPVEMPCATEEETRCDGDPGLRERGQAMWLETGSGSDPGSWEAQTAEQQMGFQGARDLWGIEHSVGVPKALGKETDCASIPAMWETGQLPGGSQAVVVPGTLEDDNNYDGIPGLWERQQTLGTPLTEVEAVPGLNVRETHTGNVLRLWERRSIMGEQEDLVPAALEASGLSDQETSYGTVLCLCGRKQAMGVSETVGMSQAAGVPKHRCALAGVPIALEVTGPGKIPARVPAAVWASGPVCQENSARDVMNLWERTHASGMPVDSGGPMSPEELWSVGKDNGSEPFPGSWGRRQAVEVYGSPEVQTGSGSFTGFLGRRQTVGTPAIMGVSPASGGPLTSRVPRPLREEAVSGTVFGLCRERQAVGGPADARVSTRMPTCARVPEPMEEKTGTGCISGLSGGRQTAGVYRAMGFPEPLGEERHSKGLLSLSGRGQTTGMPVTARVSMAMGVPTASGPQMEPGSGSGDDSSIWGRRLVTEVPTAASRPGSVEEEMGSEGVSGLWQRRTSRTVPEAIRVSVPLGTLAAVGVPKAGRVPAAVWVTGSSGEEAGVDVSGLTVVRRQSTEGAGASGEESGGRGILGLAGTCQTVGASHTCGGSARFWSCPRSMGEETACENVPRVSRTRLAVVVPPVSREEIGLSHFRDPSEQRGRRQVGEVPGIRAMGNDLGQNYVGGDRLGRAFQ
ncbi:collagen alpha-2(I) chain [Sciurus carolinensis]|uniref:collagen alpha-2(I) chain n=1 Tax=Sciurus carolinensis TaxID=30640 RepID=UPI001FB33308|nr:collagen alpha-2(I) chain [Sciurus carolinensis]